MGGSNISLSAEGCQGQETTDASRAPQLRLLHQEGRTPSAARPRPALCSALLLVPGRTGLEEHWPRSKWKERRLSPANGGSDVLTRDPLHVALCRQRGRGSPVPPGASRSRAVETNRPTLSSLVPRSQSRRGVGCGRGRLETAAPRTQRHRAGAGQWGEQRDRHTGRGAGGVGFPQPRAAAGLQAPGSQGTPSLGDKTRGPASPELPQRGSSGGFSGDPVLRRKGTSWRRVGGSRVWTLLSGEPPRGRGSSATGMGGVSAGESPAQGWCLATGVGRGSKLILQHANLISVLPSLS